MLCLAGGRRPAPPTVRTKKNLTIHACLFLQCDGINGRLGDIGGLFKVCLKGEKQMAVG